MRVVNTPILDTACSIFSDLGYTVEAAGDELRAQRKWRVVYITDRDPLTVPDQGNLRCFVTAPDRAQTVVDRIETTAPTREWVVMSLDHLGEYEIHRPSR
ncbi:DUF7116 family protein [Halocatena halophila]|uniref:DUF7116 family protein n=1 Tax=Halocatena halophila TaxID=2814576 RepID=UPI002ED4925F